MCKPVKVRNTIGFSGSLQYTYRLNQKCSIQQEVWRGESGRLYACDTCRGPWLSGHSYRITKAKCVKW